MWSEGAAFPRSLSTDNSSHRQKGSRRCPMSLLWNNEDLPGAPPHKCSPSPWPESYHVLWSEPPVWAELTLMKVVPQHCPGNQASCPHNQGHGLLKDSEPDWGPVSERGGLESQRGRGPSATPAPGSKWDCQGRPFCRKCLILVTLHIELLGEVASPVSQLEGEALDTRATPCSLHMAWLFSD